MLSRSGQIRQAQQGHVIAGVADDCDLVTEGSQAQQEPRTADPTGEHCDTHVVQSFVRLGMHRERPSPRPRRVPSGHRIIRGVSVESDTYSAATSEPPALIRRLEALVQRPTASSDSGLPVGPGVAASLTGIRAEMTGLEERLAAIEDAVDAFADRLESRIVSLGTIGLPRSCSRSTPERAAAGQHRERTSEALQEQASAPSTSGRRRSVPGSRTSATRSRAVSARSATPCRTRRRVRPTAATSRRC